MKKIFSLICALSALIFGALFTGCDADDNEFIAPKDTWVYRAKSNSNHSIEYKWTSSDGKEKTINFDVYANYATEEDTLNFNNNGTAEVLKGMNIILVPDLTTDEAKSNITELVKDAANIDKICFFKAFGEKPKVETTETTSSEKEINISSTLWTLIYNFNRFDKYTEKQFDQFTAGLTLVAESTNLNLKRVLYNLIGERLFADN
jgi:uncharacterized protein YxeA